MNMPTPSCSKTSRHSRPISSSPPKHKWYQQAFNTDWLEDERFKSWLKQDISDKYTAYCTVCDIKLNNCNKSAVLTHQQSARHAKNVASKKHTKNEPIDYMPVRTSPVKEHVIMHMQKKRPHSQEMLERHEEPQKKISRKMMNFYNLQHSDHETIVLKSLANDEAFMDVTLTSEGKALKAHKNVLSAMSSYFREVLSSNPCQHPIIVMPRDITFEELKNIITYIYQGEVSVSSREIGSLLKSARVLEVSGLCDLTELEGQPDEYGETSPLDEFAEPCLILEEVDADISGGAPKLVAKRGRPKRSYHKRTPQKKKMKDEEMQLPDDLRTHQVTSPEEPDPPEDPDPPEEGGIDSGNGLILPTVDPSQIDRFDPIRLFMCECGVVFTQQTLLDDHKKKGCGGASKMKIPPPLDT